MQNDLIWLQLKILVFKFIFRKYDWLVARVVSPNVFVNVTSRQIMKEKRKPVLQHRIILLFLLSSP